VKSSTSISPFQIVNGRSPRGVVELTSLSEKGQKSADVESFAEHMKEVHEQVHKQLQKTSQQYKQRADVKIRLKIFEEGYLVLVHLRKERFPRGTYTKLKNEEYWSMHNSKENF